MKYLAGLVVGIAILFVAVIAIIAVRSGNDKTSKNTTPTINLNDYTNKNSEVKIDLRGPIVADETHQAMTISITPTARRIVIYSGYNRKVVSEVSLPNNQAAYTSFINALSKTGFVTNKSNKNTDSNGVCSDGNIYTFELLDSGNSLNKNWASTCSDKDGTFKGNIRSITDLFESQFPDYKENTANLNI